MELAVFALLGSTLFWLRSFLKLNPIIVITFCINYCMICVFPTEVVLLVRRWFQVLECCHYLALETFTSHKPSGGLYSDRTPPNEGLFSDDRTPPNGGLYSDRTPPGGGRVCKSANSSPLAGRKSITEVKPFASLSGKPPAVTLLLGETRDAIGKLPFSLPSLTSSVGEWRQSVGPVCKTSQLVT